MAKGDILYKKALRLASNEIYNYQEVIEILEKAISLGNPNASYALATWYLHGKHVKKNYQKGFELLELACKSGTIQKAFFDIAICYEKGKGTLKNNELAFKNYLMASLLGDKNSKYEIGRCFYYGIGIKKDKEFGEKIIEFI